MNRKYKIIKIKDYDLSRYKLVYDEIFQIKLYHLNNLESYIINVLNYENNI